MIDQIAPGWLLSVPAANASRSWPGLVPEAYSCGAPLGRSAGQAVPARRPLRGGPPPSFGERSDVGLAVASQSPVTGRSPCLPKEAHRSSLSQCPLPLRSMNHCPS